MEWGHEEATQESSRGGPRQVRRLSPERAQAAGPPRKGSQGRPGQKPQEENCATQRPRPTAGTPEEEVSAAVASIRARFGYCAIGLGCGGIRFSTCALR
jgi:hypothetical protein